MKHYIYIPILSLVSLYFGAYATICKSHPIQTDKKRVNISVTDTFTLPELVSETSGLIYYRGLLWTFNDSGGEPELYGYSVTDKRVVSRITLWNGKNYDWEEITQDSTHVYIGDFGNNFGNRNNLCIYVVDKKSMPAKGKNKLIKAAQIHFTYPEYKAVPFFSLGTRSSFDCEAMIWHKDSLYLFTKDWVHRTSSIYRLPDSPGKYEAQKIGEFDSQGLITAATYFKGRLFLLGYQNFIPFIWMFDNIKNFRLKAEKGKRYALPMLAGKQTEGIAAIDSNTVFISEEKTLDAPQLFRVCL